jgi:lactoylglutathione lyase
MNFDHTGFILYVDEYEECVRFYRDLLALPIQFETPDLTCFAFGSSYLMIERGDQKHGSLTHDRFPTCLRMNVKDVKACADQLQQQGIEVDYQEHDWGTVAKFKDPAGNMCAFKDQQTFQKQLEEAKRAR